ncbi:hypothetical protein PENTCL1PPCAC_28993 [Pristionchus entomophagus]|uniref:BTB domain-containing protein n=1 Tax=Pristionchus entomophagus TaxID=358040 RepID=A0AAV5ULK8_9BILA|nr:hypothetical protein PENTCL1PPCAC_28993 [Pristionchus entomophagus]
MFRTMVGRRKREASTTVEALRKDTDEGTSNGTSSRAYRPSASRPDPESAQETIKWEIEGVSNIDDQGKNSPTITIKGIKWYIRVRTECSDRTQNETNFSIYIYCLEKNHLDVWYADVLSNIRLINRRDKAKDKHEKFSYRFNHSLTNSGYASFIKVADLLSPDQGFISENKIKLEASIAVIKIHGLPSSPASLDFSVPTENISDGVLVIGGKKLFISKQFLAINSPVFEALFFRGFKEAKQNEIELEEVNYDEFVELLNVLYNTDIIITPSNCSYLLKLADRFEIKSVMKRAEHFLCTCYQYPDFALASRLRLADEYNLFEAQHAVLLKLTKLSEVTSLKNQRDYVPISDTVKLLVTDIQLKLTNKN